MCVCVRVVRVCAFIYGFEFWFKRALPRTYQRQTPIIRPSTEMASAADNNNKSASPVVLEHLAAIQASLRRLEKDMSNVKKILGHHGSFYETHESVHYKRSLLDSARAFQKSGGRISQQEASELWDDAMDDGKVSAVERRTLQYALATLNFTECGAEYLKAQLGGQQQHPVGGNS